MSALFSYLNCKGPLYAYLGHFSARKYLEQGHNDGPGEGDSGFNDAERQDLVAQQLLAGRAPNIPTEIPGGA
jgi:hypothetical protein